MADVDRLMDERYGGEWWRRRATQPEPEPVGPSLPDFTEDELQARRRRRELVQAVREFDAQHRPERNHG